MIRRVFRFIGRYFYALGSCVYLFLGGFLAERHRDFIAAICRHFGLEPAKNDIIEKCALSEVAPGADRAAIVVLDAPGYDGSISLQQVVTMAKIIRARDPKAIFEIGTFNGRSALNMAANCSAGAKVYTLDLPPAAEASLPLSPGDKSLTPKQRRRLAFEGTEFENWVQPLLGDSATFDFSPFYGRMDLVFVDGSHSYEYVLSDSANALKLLRNGRGMILWDDYGGVWDGVTRALNELYQGSSDFKGFKRIREGGFVCLLHE